LPDAGKKRAVHLITMTALQRLIPRPNLLEIDCIDVHAPAVRVWDWVRQAELAHGSAIRALFSLRNLATRRAGGVSPTIRIDDLRSSPEHPGFQILADEPPHELAVGAIGKVWRLDIPFVHVGDDRSFAAFSQPDYIKVAWAIRVLPRGPRKSHVEVEVRVASTDEASWRKFRRYFRLIGPFSRFIRRSLLRTLARDAAAHRTDEGQHAA
jgi:hypothetical protein